MDTPWVVLMPSAGLVPLCWVTWDGDGLVCHLSPPDDATLRSRLVHSMLDRAPCPCLLHHPVEQQWYEGEVYVADINVTGTRLVAIGDVVQTCTVTLVPSGPLCKTTILPVVVQRLCNEHYDAGHQYRRPAAPLAVHVKE